MAQKRHDENFYNVIKSLERKNDLRINGSSIFILTDKVWDRKEGKEIINPKKHFDLGNKSWGKIDYLTKYQGYIIQRVGEFSNQHN